MLEKKLIQNGRKNPKKIIFIYNNKKITYSEFLNYVFYFSKFLKKKINKKSKVLLLQNNCIEWAIHYFSIRLAGLTPVIISDLMPYHKLRTIINENKIRYESNYFNLYNLLMIGVTIGFLISLSYIVIKEFSKE